MLILLITDPSVLNLLLHVSSVYCVYLLCPLSVLCVFTHTYTYTHIHTYIYVCSKVFFILFHLQNTLCNLFHMQVLNFKRAVNFISWSVFFFSPFYSFHSFYSFVFPVSGSVWYPAVSPNMLNTHYYITPCYTKYVQFFSCDITTPPLR